MPTTATPSALSSPFLFSPQLTDAFPLFRTFSLPFSFSSRHSHTNWLNALRRSYNRRVTDRSDNPFYQWIRVPGSVVDAERAAEHEAEEKEWEEKYGTKYPGSTDGGHGPKAVWDDEEKKLREAEKGLSAQSTYAKNKAAAAAVKQENGEYVSEAGAAEVNMSGFSNEAKVPVTEEALDDGFNAEMADVIAADGVKEDNGEEDEEWYEEQRAVEWKDLSLETKVRCLIPLSASSRMRTTQS